MKKTMKKIASIGVATAVAATSLTGALAANLGDYPAPFVENGVADVQIVVGQNAATSDVVGAIDISASLQADAVTTESVDTGAGTARDIENGVSVGSSGDHIVLNEALNATEASFDDNDMPDILADGTVTEDDDDDEFDYVQKLFLRANQVKFDESDIDSGTPIVYLDLEDTTTDVLWKSRLDFTGNDLDITALDDSETIEILGKTFTFDASIGATDEIVLFGSDETAFFELNVPKTVTSEGTTFEVEIVGANSEADNDNGYIILQVNGERETLNEGESTNVNGLDIYVQDLFVTDIPTLSASANLFIGAQEVKLPAGSASPTWTAVEITDEDVQGMEVLVTATTNNTDIDMIEFRLVPSDLQNDIDGFDETEYLAEGESITDPMFGTFEVYFVGSTSELEDDSKAMLEVRGGQDDVEITFVNDGGDEISFIPFTVNGTNDNLNDYWSVEGEGWNGIVTSGTALEKEQIFALNEVSAESETKLFEVQSFLIKNGQNLTKIKDLATGDVDEYSIGEEVFGDVTVLGINVSSEDVTLSAATVDRFYLKGGKSSFQFSAFAGINASSRIDIFLNESDTSSETSATVFNISLDVDSDDDADVTVNDIGGVVEESDDEDGDYNYFLSQFGTYAKVEIDENDMAMFWVPQEEDYEVYYDVFFAPSDANVVISGSGSVTTSRVNSIGVGVGVLDVDVNSANPPKNLIVVGGPAINSVADDLLSTRTADPLSVFNPGEAIVELFDLDNGKVAMLVAGYEALETQAATRQVSAQNSDLFVDGATSATLTVSSLNSVDISTN